MENSQKLDSIWKSGKISGKLKKGMPVWVENSIRRIEYSDAKD